MLHHDLQPGHLVHELGEHLVEEDALAIEHVHAPVRHLAVNLQHATPVDQVLPLPELPGEREHEVGAPRGVRVAYTQGSGVFAQLGEFVPM